MLFRSEIASKHKRTPNAIMFKLDQEQLAYYNVLYSNYHNLNSPIPIQRETIITPLLRPTYSLKVSNEYSDDDEEEAEFDDENDEDYVDNADDEHDYDDDEEYDEEEDESRLSKRVYKLENSLDEIKNMLKSLISNKEPMCGIKGCEMSSCV